MYLRLMTRTVCAWAHVMFISLYYCIATCFSLLYISVSFMSSIYAGSSEVPSTHIPVGSDPPCPWPEECELGGQVMLAEYAFS